MAERIGDLEDDLEGPFLGERFLLYELAERYAPDELHRDVEPFFPLPLAVELDDVGMVGHSDDLRLFQKAVRHLFILHVFRDEDFDDNRLRCAGVGSEVKEAHTSLIQKAFDFVGADFLRYRGGCAIVKIGPYKIESLLNKG